jgi:hypothetical protein
MGGWMDGWVGGRESGVKDCLQQSKIYLQKILRVQLLKQVKQGSSVGSVADSR